MRAPSLRSLALMFSALALVRRYSHLAPENFRTAVSRLDDVLKTAPSARLGTRRAQEEETLVASK